MTDDVWPRPTSGRHHRASGWVGALASLAAIAALVVGRALGRVNGPSIHARVIVWAAALALLVFGVVAMRETAGALGRRLAERSSPQAGSVLRLGVHAAGLVVLLFAELGVLGVSATHLLLGAGVAGIVLGIAAQQSLANVIAAVVLVVARPFRVGDRIQLRSGSVGTLDVTILDLGLTYVTMRTDTGVLRVPNAAVLSAGIGHPTPPTGAPPASS